MQKLERTFGIEIEFGLPVAIELETFKSEFEMRTGEVAQMDYHYSRDFSRTKWMITNDMSVRIRGCRTIELKAPPIKLSEINRIKKVYEYLNEIGKVNIKCGTHVHIDASDLTFKQQKKVLIAYLVNEDVIDMMHPKSRRFGQGGYGSQFCGSGAGRSHISIEQRNRSQDFLGRDRMPTSSFDATYNQLQEHYKSVVINACIQKIKRARNVRQLKTRGFGDKYSNVNFKEAYKTIEFRQHSGTLEFNKISNWIVFLNQFVIGFGYGPSVAKKNETRENGRDRLFFRKVSQLEKSVKNRVKTYGGFEIPNAEQAFTFLKKRISHFIRVLNGNSTYERAMRKVLEDRGVTFNLRGGNDDDQTRH